jgi:hypothetical protein
MFAPCLVVGRGWHYRLLCLNDHSLLRHNSCHKEVYFRILQAGLVLQGLRGSACNIYPAWSCLLSGGWPYYNFCVLPSAPCIMALSPREREAIP